MSAETRKKEIMGLLLLLLAIGLGTDNTWGLLSRFSVEAFQYCSSPTSSSTHGRTRRLSPNQDESSSPFGTNTYARGSVYRTIAYATGSSGGGGVRDSEKDKKNAVNRKKTTTAKAELTGWGMNFQEPSSSFSSFISSSKRKRGVKSATKSENSNWSNWPRDVFSLDLPSPPTGQSSSSSSKMMPRSKNKSAVASNKKSVYQSADPQKLIRLTDYLKSGPAFPKSTSSTVLSSSSSELFGQQTANLAKAAAQAPSATAPSTRRGVALDQLAREWAAINKDRRDDRAAYASAGIAPPPPPPSSSSSSSLPIPSGGTMSTVSMDRLAQEWAAINRDASAVTTGPPQPTLLPIPAVPAPVVARGTTTSPSMDDLAKAWASTNKDTDSPKATPPIPYSPPPPPSPKAAPAPISHGVTASTDDLAKAWGAMNKEPAVSPKPTPPVVLYSPPPPPQPQPKAAPIPRGAKTSMDDLAKAWAAMTKETDSPKATTPPIPYSPPSQSQPKAAPPPEPPAVSAPTGVTTAMDDLAKAWSSMNIDQDATPRLPNVKPQVAAFAKPTPLVEEPSSTPLSIPATMDDLAKAWASRNMDPDAAPRPPNVKN